MHPDEQAQIEAMVRANFFPGDRAVQGMFDALMEMSRIGAGVSYILSANDESEDTTLQIHQYHDGFRVFSSDIHYSVPRPTLAEALDRAVSTTREIHDKGGL